jgi:tRNA1(Val) A37 N6-methylase TrmN6
MALMFQRLAHNFIKNGYYPSDGETTRRILNALVPSEGGSMHILDPCCGEGVALAECRSHLGPNTQTFGVEFDEERAAHGKRMLDRCIHGDLMDCVIGPRQFGLLWLNPPYGDLVYDQSGATTKWKGRKRLEKLFYAQTNGLLQFGGVMVLIVPSASLDTELSTWIAQHCTNVRVYRAPEQQFHQVVVLGIRRRSSEARAISEVRDRLAAVGAGGVPEELPESYNAPYSIPSAVKVGTFVLAKMEPVQLAKVIKDNPCLWSQFDLYFSTVAVEHRPPLRAMSDWHLSLALAAGQVSGIVRSKDGRCLVIKGDTHKTKTVRVEHETDKNGLVLETRIRTDQFVPTIRALDFTPGSETYGKILKIS